MTPADLKALDAAATPGPWAPSGSTWIEAGESGFDEVISPADVKCGAYCQGGSSRVEFPAADRALTIAARNALPALTRLWEAAEHAMHDAPVLLPHHFYKINSDDMIPLDKALCELREMKL